MSTPVIDVFLMFDPGDRNTVTTKKDGVRKVTLVPGPNWAGLVPYAKKAGFTLKVHGPKKSMDSATISDSLKTSVSTIIVGHGGGSFEGKKWVSNQIKLSDGMIIAPDSKSPGGLMVGEWEGNTLKPLPSSPTPIKPKTNQLTGLFTCNSHDRLREMFDIPEGSNIVTNDGGSDGLTRVGTLENAAYAFVQEYIRTAGDTKKALVKSQAALKSGGGYARDKGDKLHVGP
jgi:hypothetical protein